MMAMMIIIYFQEVFHPSFARFHQDFVYTIQLIDFQFIYFLHKFLV